MEIQFVAGVAVISDDLKASRAFYDGTLGLPLEGDEYPSSGELAGLKHFGLWPLRAAAQTCFGRDQWPEGLPTPTCGIEFELASVEAVQAGADELIEAGYELIHNAKQEPWGQTVARLLSPEANLVGLSYTPWMH